MAFPLSATALAVSTHEITVQESSLYLFSAENQDTMTLYIKDGQTEIPYIEMGYAMEWLVAINQLFGDLGYSLTFEQEGKTIAFVRENGSAMYLDFAKKEIGWTDFNQFILPSNASHSLDVVATNDFDKTGRPLLIKRGSASFSRQGEPIYLSFEDFIIDVFYQDGKGYIPFQTFSDLFLSGKGVNFAYNGEAVFLAAGGSLGGMEELYYSVKPKKRSRELIQFNYEELCLSLQFNYGLKELHDIPSFNKLFLLTGVEEKLKSPNALIADTALRDVINGFIDDGHSTFVAASPYAGNVKVPYNVEAAARQHIFEHLSRYETASKVNFPDGVPFYQEIGNTAYVTFQSFTMKNRPQEYYQALENGELEELAAEDTVALIMYAHQQITRENSPIENVVIDLSRNTGGAVDAAVFTAAWFLGASTLNIEDAITEARSSIQYLADVNGDHVFDEKDNVASLNRYCLISPVSFSCGNLVPSLFKSSHQVTLLGRQSGGGACAVQYLTNADGTLWRLSSRYRLSTVFNGSFYDIDQGVEPDILIDKLSNYYDRNNLTNYINERL